MDEKILIEEKNRAEFEIKEALRKLHEKVPNVTEGLSALLGSGVGATCSLVALGALGTAGFSAAGITSGLATAGAIVGGGMVAGIGVLATPVVVLGIGGYMIAQNRNKAKTAIEITTAIKKIHEVQERLMQNAEYFKEELAGIKIILDEIEANAVKQNIQY